MVVIVEPAGPIARAYPQRRADRRGQRSRRESPATSRRPGSSRSSTRTRTTGPRPTTTLRCPIPSGSTWDGVALHAGGIPGHPESHGCVHLPYRPSRSSSSASRRRMTVVIANDATAPRDAAIPACWFRWERRGTPDRTAAAGGSRQWRWQPENFHRGPGHARCQRGRTAGPRPAQRGRDRSGGHRDRVAGKTSWDGGVRAQVRSRPPRRTR